MKTCTSCKQEKSLDSFGFRNKSKGLLASKCKQCQKEYYAVRWASGKIKESNYQAKAKRVKAAQDYLWGILIQSKCWDCGERNPIVLEFDHLKDKTKDVSKMVSQNYGVETIRKEVNKCDVVCANCHKIRTSTRGNHWRYQRQNPSSSSV